MLGAFFGARVAGDCFQTLLSYTGPIKTNIRPATLSDAAVLADFNDRMAWETEERRLDPARVAAGVASLLQDAAKGTYFVAETNTATGLRVVGQLLITYEWSDWRNGNFWWIQSVYVAEDARGAGVFRALFQHVHTLARARPEVCGLRLYMDAHNSRARQAYEKMGLKQTDYQVFEIDFVQEAS